MNRAARTEKPRFFLHSIQSKLLILLGIMLTLILGVNIYIFSQSRYMLRRIDQAFVSNVSIIELTDKLNAVESSVYEYLNTRSSSALENFYRFEQEYMNLTEELNNSIVKDETMMLERNIRLMSRDYIDHAEAAVQAKRGRNVEEYRTFYEETERIYGYISTYIYELNSLRFRQNSENYRLMLNAFSQMEIFSLILILIVFGLISGVASLLVHAMIRPLTSLASAANRVAEGDLDVSVGEAMSDDEVGIVTNAFSKMLDSIRLYIMRQRTALETEARMKQQELSMAAHLREAQLRYLQAQINPHFLFNSLNAGAQLAMLEGAEKTEDFLGRMADFFRYNVKKTGGTATLEEEIVSVDNYIYILNVRFAGDIHYSCRIGDGIPLKEIEMPSMILQPIVENAIQHGIHDDHENGKVLLGAERIGPEENETGRECICITVSDNGCGMTSAQLEALMKLSADRRSWENRGNVPPGIPEGGRDTEQGAASGEQAAGAEEEAADAGDSSEQGSGAGSAGIALANVMSRLELYYNEKNLFSIWSDGAGCGTEVTVLLPIQKKTEEDRLSGQE